MSALLSMWCLLDQCFGITTRAADVEGRNALPLGLAEKLDQQRFGIRGRLDIAVQPYPALACFLDPVTVGLMLIGESMCQSIRNSWRLVQQTHNAKHAGRAAAMRLAPQAPSCQCLEGDSAGRAFRIGMLLTANGDEYDSSTVIS